MQVRADFTSRARNRCGGCKAAGGTGRRTTGLSGPCREQRQQCPPCRLHSGCTPSPYPTGSSHPLNYQVFLNLLFSQNSPLLWLASQTRRPEAAQGAGPCPGGALPARTPARAGESSMPQEPVLRVGSARGSHCSCFSEGSRLVLSLPGKTRPSGQRARRELRGRRGLGTAGGGLRTARCPRAPRKLGWRAGDTLGVRGHLFRDAPAPPGLRSPFPPQGLSGGACPGPESGEGHRLPRGPPEGQRGAVGARGLPVCWAPRVPQAAGSRRDPGPRAPRAAHLYPPRPNPDLCGRPAGPDLALEPVLGAGPAGGRAWGAARGLGRGSRGRAGRFPGESSHVAREHPAQGDQCGRELPPGDRPGASPHTSGADVCTPRATWPRGSASLVPSAAVRATYP